MSGYLSKNAPGEGNTKDLTAEEQATVQVGDLTIWSSCRGRTLRWVLPPTGNGHDPMCIFASGIATRFSTTQRRLLLGIGFTVAAAAFALVPTEELRGRPTQPLFFYLVPVLRSRQLLDQALQLDEGDTTGRQP